MREKRMLRPILALTCLSLTLCLGLPAGVRAEAGPGGAHRRPVDELGDYVRIRHRSEPVPESSLRKGLLSESEVALSLPVNSGVSLQGGMRFHYRAQSATAHEALDMFPTLGIELRF